MKNKKTILIKSFIIFILTIFISTTTVYAEKIDIDKTLKQNEYSNLSETVKDYIKEYYKKHGLLLVTYDNAKEGQAYINPDFITYLDSKDKSKYGLIPYDVGYIPKKTSNNNETSKVDGVPVLPSKFDLRSDNGKNYVSPVKDQDANNCWAYATASMLETHDLIRKNKSYDSSATLFSAKQLDYASSYDGAIGGNKVGTVRWGALLGEGAQLSDVSEILAKYLGSATSSWDDANRTQINNIEKLEPSIIYNRSNFVYEVEETFESNRTINTNDQATIGELKSNIYNYGGVLIGTCSSFIYNGNDSLALCNNNNHALYMIGWDDNYNYSYCKLSNTVFRSVNSSGGCDSGEKVTGTGAFIIKNSWGTLHPYIYMPYDKMYIGEYLAIKKYATSKTWDNSYDLKSKDSNEYASNDFIFTVESNLEFNEKINKMKLWTRNEGDITIYYSENGNDNYVLIGSYNATNRGYFTIDLSSKNLNINNNSVFKLTTTMGYNITSRIHVFTTNTSSTVTAKTLDYEYSPDDVQVTKDEYLDMYITTEIRGLSDNVSVDYKIKTTGGEYLPTNAYQVTVNKTYYNLVSPVIKLKESYAKKGNYILETYYNNKLLSTSNIKLDVDYYKFKGSGTYEDPWQIENVVQFNAIKNARFDYYILMNDLDFEYDTQNKNGLFYNDGDGWQAIYFKGNFNGNNKTIKNLKTNDGLFYELYYSNDARNYKCYDNECGIHDLNVEGTIYKYKNYGNSTYTGGVFNRLIISTNKKFNFNNLSVSNFNIQSNNSIGGIAGSIEIETDLKQTFNNWYADIIYSSKLNYSYLGGIVSNLTTMSNKSYISFNNIKSNIQIESSSVNEPTVSDLISSANIKNNGYLKINNAICNFIYDKDALSGLSPNSVLGTLYSSDNTNISVNGLKTTLNLNNNDITATNSEFGLKSYELPHKNYNNLAYYEKDNITYPSEESYATKINFIDKFSLYDDRVPTLNSSNEKYSDFYKNYAIKINESKSISDLISNNKNHHKLSLYTSFNCNLSACNNNTDTKVVSLTKSGSDYTFKGLKQGSTTLILYDEVSGYLNTVNVTVIGSDEYKLTLNANYPNGVNEIRGIKTNDKYGTLPTLTRPGHNFLGWYTKASGGTKITSSTTFTGTKDTTIYAHWEEKTHVVNFDYNSGTGSTNQIEVAPGSTITFPAATNEGYTFVSWTYNEKNIDTNFDLSEYDEITFVAKWIDNIAPSFSFKPAANGKYIKSSKSIEVTLSDSGSGLSDYKYTFSYSWEQDECSNPKYNKNFGFGSLNGNSGAKSVESYLFPDSNMSGEYYLCIYPGAKDLAGNINSEVTKAGPYKFDSTKPTVSTISGGKTVKSKTQSVTLKCTDNNAVTAYYWGTTSPASEDLIKTTTSADLTKLNNSTGITKTISKSGTYYFACRDEAGNFDTKSIVIRDYYVFNLIQKETGTADTYTSANYSVDTNDSYIIKSGTSVDVTKIYAIPTSLTSDNYKGYSTAYNSTNQTMLTTNLTISATTNVYTWFNRNNVTVTFNSDGGSAIDPQTIAYYGTVTQPTNPTKTGYTFKEWQYNGTTFDFSTNITADMTLDAVWTINSYNVTFNANGGTGTMSTQKIKYNTPTKLKKNTFTRDGYTFTGWNTKANGSGTTYTDEQKITIKSKLTLYAQWSELDPFITSSTQSVEFGTLNVGFTSNLTKKITIKNTSSEDVTLTINSPTSDGPFDTTGFENNHVLAPNETYTVKLVVKPSGTNASVPGEYNGTYKITATNASGENTSVNVTAHLVIIKVNNMHIAYTTHVENIGWQSYVKDGAMAGTQGKAYRLEGIKIKLENQEYAGDIEYRTHIQYIGWEKNFKKNDEMSGTEGKAYRLEAIEIKLTGEMAEHYDVYYRVHAENFGWLGWARNGERSGTAGYAYRLEGIEIRLVKKELTFDEYGKGIIFWEKGVGGTKPNQNTNPDPPAPTDKLVSYTTHVQNIGWQDYVFDGAMAGTEGKAYRLEGIKIKLVNPQYSGNIEYRTHIQYLGWESSFKKNDEMSGTEGKAYRLEAIEIKLTDQMASNYDVYYRVHAENFGWLGWAKNGEQAGTAGYAYRLEGIEIKLLPKGQTPSGYGTGNKPFYNK